MIRYRQANGTPIDLAKTRDHYIPLSRGGLNVKENIRSACYRCNALKGDMMPDAWEQFMRDNPYWWQIQVNKPQRPSANAIAKRREKLDHEKKIAMATELLKALRADPDYIPVPQSYEDDFAQLCYEVAMQNPRNWTGQPFTKKAAAAKFKRMTADENARRIRAYWARVAGMSEKLSL